MKFFLKKVMLLVLAALLVTGCAGKVKSKKISMEKQWVKAQVIDTKKEYEGFLNRFPQGEYSNQARYKIEEIYFEKVNTMDSYEEFLKRYPTEHSDMAESFFKAVNANSFEDYMLFLSHHSEGRFVEEIQRLAIRAAKTVKVVVKQYRVDRNGMKTRYRMHLPFYDLATKYLGYAGLSEEKDKAADLIFYVDAEGTALGADYTDTNDVFSKRKTHLYTGASLSGAFGFRVKSSPSWIYKRYFESEADTVGRIEDYKGQYSRRANAPFRRAFYQSGSFPTVMPRIMADIYGVNPLIAALKDDDQQIREAAASALLHVTLPRVEPLIAALKDDSLLIREAAAKALVRSRNSLAVEPLIALSKSKSIQGRRIAMDSLIAMGFRSSDLSNVESDVRSVSGTIWLRSDNAEYHFMSDGTLRGKYGDNNYWIGGKWMQVGDKVILRMSGRSRYGLNILGDKMEGRRSELVPKRNSLGSRYPPMKWVKKDLVTFSLKSR